MSIPAPPIPLNGLSPPLTADQRNRIIAWCHLASVAEGIEGWSNSSLPANFDSLPDDQILAHYAAEVTIANLTNTGGFQINPITALKNSSVINPLTGQDVHSPLASVEQFLGQLTNSNLWTRVAEFGIGGILLAVGLNAMLRPGQSLSSGVTKSIAPLRAVSRAVNQQSPETARRMHTKSVNTLGSRSHSIHYKR